MNFEALVPFIKKALAIKDISNDEIRANLSATQQGDKEDQNNETVDSTLTDLTAPSKDEVDNEEGKLLETAFKEVEVEQAIEQAKEESKFRHIDKTSSIWDQLVLTYNKNKL